MSDLIRLKPEIRTTGEIDDVVGNISAGVTVLGTGRGVVTLSYDGSFGDDIESHSAAAKATLFLYGKAEPADTGTLSIKKTESPQLSRRSGDKSHVIVQAR